MMETYNLFCIKEVRDPRYSDVCFEVNDKIVLYEKGGVIKEINGISLDYQPWHPNTFVQTDDERITIVKRAFFEDLKILTGFNMSEHFVNLAEYRQKRIEDILND